MPGFMDKLSGFLVGGDGLRDPAEIHISQVGDEFYNDGAPGATANCGPTSVLMAIRLLGRDVPGASRYKGEALVEFVRYLATGDTNRMVGTTNLHLQRVLEKAGCKWRILRDVRSMLKAVIAGEPVIMGGNPTAKGCYAERFDYIDLRRWDSGHWIVVSRFNADRKTFTINDPQSTIGPIEATAKELAAFAEADEVFGIAVQRA